MNRGILVGVLALVAVALVGGYLFLQRDGDEATVLTGDTATQTDAGGTATADAGNDDAFRFSWSEFPEFQPVLEPANRREFLTPNWTDTGYGDPEAPVQIVEFFSYACPHCKRFHEGPYQQILADYVDTGLVYFIKRDFLLGSGSVGFELLAGAGAQCLIDSSQSQAFADIIFDQQRVLASSPDPVEALVPVFAAVGVEETMARSCMADQKNRSLVFGRSVRSTTVGPVTGTPTLFINQRKYNGNTSDYSALAAEIERALASAS